MTAERKAEIARLNGVIAAIQPRYGDIAIPEAKAVLHLGQAYYFLSAADARRVIVEIWGNPPDQADGVLGMVFPEGVGFGEAWGAVITYEHTDFVADTDANSADYDTLLQTARASEAEDNKDRSERGFPTAHLVGWAQPPAYDAQNHYLIWARDIRFSESAVDALNYDIRLLGRRGVLSLNIVSKMPELEQVRADATALAKTAAYEPGSRYADYDKTTDKAAGYGVAGLVAAGLGVAAVKKVGLLALLALFLKKGFVIVLALLAGVGGWIKRALGGRKAQASTTPEPEMTLTPVQDAEPPAPSELVGESENRHDRSGA